MIYLFFSTYLTMTGNNCIDLQYLQAFKLGNPDLPFLRATESGVWSSLLYLIFEMRFLRNLS